MSDALKTVCLIFSRKQTLGAVWSRNISFAHPFPTGPCSAVGNVSDYRWVSDCRSRGRKFDPSQVPYLVEIDREIISKIIFLPSSDSFKKGCCQRNKRKYVHKVLVNCLFKHAQEKSDLPGT